MGSRRARMVWMDILRGMAILLVVMFHAHGRVAQDFGNYSEVVRIGIQSAGPIRMPTLMLLSGILLAGSLSKGSRKYLDGKLRNIAYPYLLWGALTVFVLVMVQPFTGTPHSLGDLLTILHKPPAGLWFLQNLFLFYLLALVLRRVPRHLLMGAALIVALAASLSDGGYWLTRFSFLFAFFVLGDWIGSRLDGWSRLANNRRMMLFAWGSLATFVGLAVADVDAQLAVVYFPLVVAATLGLTQLSQSLESSRAGDGLAYLGRNSLQIYVVHMIAIPLVFALLRPVLGWNPVLLSSLTILGTMIVSLAPVWLRPKIPQVQWLFSFPLFPISQTERPPTERAA